MSEIKSKPSFISGGTSIGSKFVPLFNQPLDSRIVVNEKNDLITLQENLAIYPGIEVFVISEKKKYLYNSGEMPASGTESVLSSNWIDASKIDDSSYVKYKYNTITIPGNEPSSTKTVQAAQFTPGLIYASQGLIMGGTAQQAGLTTRGICGVTAPQADGSCQKNNLYINYDGDGTYRIDRQLILQSGSPGENYGSNLYQYAAARGDAVKGWVESQKFLKNQTWRSIKVDNTELIPNNTNKELNILSGSNINITTNKDNGSLTISADLSSVAPSDHNHDTVYVKKSGDTISGNLTVTGNLTVNGDSTIINTSTLAVEDNIIEIAKNAKGLKSLAGLLIPQYGSTAGSSGILFDSSGQGYIGTTTEYTTGGEIPAKPASFHKIIDESDLKNIEVTVSNTTGTPSGSVEFNSAKKKFIFNFNNIKGDKGNDGANGLDGAKIFTGTIDPEESFGKKDDIYLNTETSDLFVKSETSWIKNGNIKGDKGNDGSQIKKSDTPLSEATIKSTHADNLIQNKIEVEYTSTNALDFNVNDIAVIDGQFTDKNLKAILYIKVNKVLSNKLQGQLLSYMTSGEKGLTGDKYIIGVYESNPEVSFTPDQCKDFSSRVSTVSWSSSEIKGSYSEWANNIGKKILLIIHCNNGDNYIGFHTIDSATSLQPDNDYWISKHGTNAIISEATASIDNNCGTPNVKVTTSGTEQNRSFDFAFHNIKGNPGLDGSKASVKDEILEFDDSTAYISITANNHLATSEDLTELKIGNVNYKINQGKQISLKEGAGIAIQKNGDETTISAKLGTTHQDVAYGDHTHDSSYVKKSGDLMHGPLHITDSSSSKDDSNFNSIFKLNIVDTDVHDPYIHAETGETGENFFISKDTSLYDNKEYNFIDIKQKYNSILKYFLKNNMPIPLKQLMPYSRSTNIILKSTNFEYDINQNAQNPEEQFNHKSPIAKKGIELDSIDGITLYGGCSTVPLFGPLNHPYGENLELPLISLTTQSNVSHLHDRDIPMFWDPLLFIKDSTSFAFSANISPNTGTYYNGNTISHKYSNCFINYDGYNNDGTPIVDPSILKNWSHDIINNLNTSKDQLVNDFELIMSDPDIYTLNPDSYARLTFFQHIYKYYDNKNDNKDINPVVTNFTTPSITLTKYENSLWLYKTSNKKLYNDNQDLGTGFINPHKSIDINGEKSSISILSDRKQSKTWHTYIKEDLNNISTITEYNKLDYSNKTDISKNPPISVIETIDKINKLTSEKELIICQGKLQIVLNKEYMSNYYYIYDDTDVNKKILLDDVYRIIKNENINDSLLINDIPIIIKCNIKAKLNSLYDISILKIGDHWVENIAPTLKQTIKLDGENGEILLNNNKVATVNDIKPLPTASASVKGGVKIGSGLKMTGDVLSTEGGGGVKYFTKSYKIENYTEDTALEKETEVGSTYLVVLKDDTKSYGSTVFYCNGDDYMVITLFNYDTYQTFELPLNIYSGSSVSFPTEPLRGFFVGKYIALYKIG